MSFCVTPKWAMVSAWLPPWKNSGSTTTWEAIGTSSYKVAFVRKWKVMTFLCLDIIVFNKSDPFDNSAFTQQQAFFISWLLSHVIFKLNDSSKNVKKYEEYCSILGVL